MATAILRSQDCLRDRCFPHDCLSASPHLKPRRNPNSVPTANANPSPNLNAASRSRRRRRSPLGFSANQQDKPQNRSRDESLVVKAPVKNLVMGEVKILKRGEPLISPKKDDREKVAVKGEKDLVLGTTDRLGPEPDTVQKEIRVTDLKVVDGVYAGSGTFTSPPPSSLPVPVFVGKNGTAAASSHLRRMLKISVL